MKVLVPGGETPHGFGIGQDDDRLWMLSKCCSEKVDYKVMEKASNIERIKGVSHGPGVVACSKCEVRYRGYSDTSCSVGWDSVSRWIQNWTNLENVTVTVEYEA